MPNAILPKPLKIGDKIAVVSPAGLVEESQLTKGLQLIDDHGYVPVLGKNLYRHYNHGYPYAGTESERLADLNNSMNDSDISAVWASRGGYGCLHLLPHLRLSGFRKQPKWFIGYSDNTVIQSFLLKNNFASIHAQSIKTSSFGVTEQSYAQIFDILAGKFPDYQVNNHRHNQRGKAAGMLVGGNLALIYALLGTRYSFNFKDKILFIEDIGEKYYSLDRMLMALDLAGVFRQIKGVIVGGMTNMGDEAENKNYASSFDEFAYDLIAERLQKYTFPKLFGFPNGHIYDNRPLIIGGEISLEVGDSSEVKYIKSPPQK